jgi:hypothetical protein
MFLLVLFMQLVSPQTTYAAVGCERALHGVLTQAVAEVNRAYGNGANPRCYKLAHVGMSQGRPMCGVEGTADVMARLQPYLDQGKQICRSNLCVSEDKRSACLSLLSNANLAVLANGL